MTFCHRQLNSVPRSGIYTVTHIYTQNLVHIHRPKFSLRGAVWTVFARGCFGYNDKLDSCNYSCLNTRNTGVLKRRREIWYEYKESRKGREMMMMMMVVKHSVLCLFWWAQLSQTASAACQPLKIAGHFSLFALWAYSQKAIKITSSLLSNLWKLQESIIQCKTQTMKAAHTCDLDTQIIREKNNDSTFFNQKTDQHIHLLHWCQC